MKKRRVRKLTFGMVAKWKGLTAAAVYQASTERRNAMMEEFKQAIKDGMIPDPLEDTK